MNKQNEGEEIRLAPPSPKLQTDGVSQWMVWEANIRLKSDSKVIANLEQLASSGDISVTVELANPETVVMTVKQAPIGDYTELYLAGIRALFRLEKCVGGLTAICGIPRDRWEVNFITARQLGPLE